MSMGKAGRLAIGAAVIGLVGVLGLLRARQVPVVGPCAEEARAPRIHPDYCDVVVPPNIAPLNFVIDEPGRRYVVRVVGAKGAPIRVAAPGGSVHIPAGPWRRLLETNRGGEVRFEVYAESAPGRWTHFAPLRNRVAPEAVDSTLVYRRLKPIYNEWHELGIYQRDLTSYRETAVIRNHTIGGSCLNCHTFQSNRPDRFIFHTRPTKQSAGIPGMVLVENGKATRIDTRTSINPRAATYSSWHPNGKLIAFSYNQIFQYFHTAGAEPREVVDTDSGLALYWVDGHKVTSAPAINDPKRLETFPGWAPDGRTLYFSSAPVLWSDPSGMPFKEALRVRYDLVRAAFDPDKGTWGPAETVLAAQKAGGSLLEPRVSPDGRFLLFCRCDYGSFPIHQQHADLYLLDLRRPGFPYRKLDSAVDSRRDSWHSWSSNSRWIVFSRKHDYGLVSRPYLRYIDADGNTAKAFAVPQADPAYYDSCTDNFNVPELVKGPITIGWRELARAANSKNPVKAVADPAPPH